jgi:hypothetical protein
MTLIWTENMIIIIYSLEVQNIQRWKSVQNSLGRKSERPCI